MAEMTAHASRLQAAITEYHLGLFHKVAEVAAASNTAASRAAAAAFSTPATPVY